MKKRLGLLYAIILVIVIALPALRWLILRKPDGVVYGYTDTIPQRPAQLTSGFANKTVQRWVERYFDVYLGFRGNLIRSFNEVNFRLFHEAPRLRLYSTDLHGLYSKMSIDNLNDEIVRRQHLEERYRTEATKLLALQNLLKARGKYFVVVIGTSKPYVYPESLGDRYLVGGPNNVFSRAARFGEVLEISGVNVIDAGPFLREFAKNTGIQTHPNSGVHWNYYAGCLVAQRLIEKVKIQYGATPLFHCGNPVYATPHMVDVDGLSLLNIWSDGGVLKSTPYPTINVVDQVAWRPSIVFIGDSFSDQIRYALQQARSYKKMITSGYFRVREEDVGSGSQVTHDPNTDVAIVRTTLEKDVAASDVVVLQMVDYNVPRWGYGFADYFLEHWLGK